MFRRVPVKFLAASVAFVPAALVLGLLALGHNVPMGFSGILPSGSAATEASSGKQDTTASETGVPGAQWSIAADPGVLGWSETRLRKCRSMLEDFDTAAFLVVTDGQVVFSYGRIATRFKLHSIRKSLLSALLGIAIQEGKIDPAASLADLHIDDNSPKLTSEEKRATVIDLMMSRSGIYHRAVYELPSMVEARPKRGRYAPGRRWYYNNWDFNVLGTIFETRTEESIGRTFARRIARPIGMEEFEEGDVESARGPQSIHPAYPFRMSARDLARFGLLYLHDGRWGTEQVLPADWVQESTRARSSTGRSGTMSGYGYMWWVARHSSRGIPKGTITASGHGGQRLVIIPCIDTVIVHLMDTDEDEESDVGTGEIDPLLKKLMAARKK